jgi:hypothetical protein
MLKVKVRYTGQTTVKPVYSSKNYGHKTFEHGSMLVPKNKTSQSVSLTFILSIKLGSCHFRSTVEPALKVTSQFYTHPTSSEGSRGFIINKNLFLLN